MIGQQERWGAAGKQGSADEYAKILSIYSCKRIGKDTQAERVVYPECFYPLVVGSQVGPWKALCGVDKKVQPPSPIANISSPPSLIAILAARSGAPHRPYAPHCLPSSTLPTLIASSAGAGSQAGIHRRGGGAAVALHCLAWAHSPRAAARCDRGAGAFRLGRRLGRWR